MMCRLEDELVSGFFDVEERQEHSAQVWLFLVFMAALLLSGWLLSGCATQKVLTNTSEDIQLILDRVHLDAQEVINHPERWAPAVDSLCHDGMITKDQCVRIQAILRARSILVGPQSRLRPIRWKARPIPRLYGQRWMG